MTKTTLTFILFIFITSLFILAVFLIKANGDFGRANNENILLQQSNKVLLTSENVISLMKDIETGTRGFILTGDSIFLEPYNLAKDSVAGIITTLKNVAGKDATNKSLLTTLTYLADRRLVLCKQLQDKRMQADYALPNIDPLLREGKRSMDSIRSVINQIQLREKSIVAIQQNRYDDSLRQSQLSFSYLLYSILILVMITVFAVWYYSNLHKAEKSTLASLTTKVSFFSKRTDDILKSISDPFFALDDNFNFKFLNDAIYSSIAVGKARLTGDNFFEAFPQYNHNIVGQKIRQVMLLGQSASFEAFDDFLHRWQDYSIYPTNEGISVHIKDAAARKDAEEKLYKTQQLLEETNQMALVGGWELDMFSNTLSWTSVTYLIHEVNAEKKPDLVSAVNYYKEGHSRDTITNLISRAIETGEGWNAELQIITAQGNEKWVRSRGTAEFENDECVRLFGTFQDIDERKRLTDKAVENQASILKLQQLLNDTNEMAMVGGWEMNMLTNEASWTRTTYTIHGEDPDKPPASVEEGVSYFKEGINRENVLQLVNHGIATGEAWDTEAQIIDKNGNEKWVRIKGIPEFKNNTCVKLSGIIQDIDEKKKLQEKIEHNQQWLLKVQQLMEETNEVAVVGGWEVNLVANTVFWTSVTYTIHEVEKHVEPNLSNGINYYKEGTSRDTITALVNHAIQTGEGWDAELQIITATGKEKWIRTKGKTGFENGKCVRLFGIFQDIDSRKKTAELLQERNKMFSSAFENPAVGMAFVNADLTVIETNQALCDMVGLSKQGLKAIKFSAITHPDDVQRDLDMVKTIMENPAKIFRYEKRYLHNNGQIIWILLSVAAVTDNQNKYKYHLSHMQDITEKKNAEDKLKSERKLLQTIIDNLPMNIYVKDTRCKKILVNTKEKEYLAGNGMANLLGKDDYDLYPYENAAISIQEDKQVFNSHTAIVSKETVSVKFNGEKTYFLTSKIPYYDEHRHLEGLIGISYDVSDIKNKEYALLQLNKSLENVTKELEEKNSELEQFATIASHDLQEPLRMITGFITLIEKKYADILDEQGREYMQLIVSGAMRMRLIISDILQYSRHGFAEEQKICININNLLHKLVSDNFTEALINGAFIEYDNMPTIMADETSMQQLFTNLIGNGLKYQPKGNKPVIKINAENTGEHWKFSVSDNGIGIKKEYFEKVFMIFKRLHNKNEYNGTGVGLAICKKIVGKYGGKIWLDSSPGVGTTFHFNLMN